MRLPSPKRSMAPPFFSSSTQNQVPGQASSGHDFRVIPSPGGLTANRLGPYDSAMAVSSPLDPEVLARLKGLRIQVQRVVAGVLAGLHRSARHGVSIEFAEHKEYSPGDEPRHLDWRVLARLDRYAVRKFEDETNLQVQIALDASGSMAYASGAFTKAAYGALLAASLATLLLRQGDAAGLLILSADQPVELPPLGTNEQLGEIVRALQALRPAGATRLRDAATRYMERARRRGMLILLSDLFDPDEDLLAGLKMVAARGHQVAVFHLLDRDEILFPFEDPSQFESLEDDRRLLATPRDIRQAYLAELGRFLRETRRALSNPGLTYELVRTDEPPHQPLIRHLSARRGGSRNRQAGHA